MIFYAECASSDARCKLLLLRCEEISTENDTFESHCYFSELIFFHRYFDNNGTLFLSQYHVVLCHFTMIVLTSLNASSLVNFGSGAVRVACIRCVK